MRIRVSREFSATLRDDEPEMATCCCCWYHFNLRQYTLEPCYTVSGHEGAAESALNHNRVRVRTHTCMKSIS